MNTPEHVKFSLNPFIKCTYETAELREKKTLVESLTLSWAPVLISHTWGHTDTPGCLGPGV